jgi:hypothetical protein
MVVGLRTPATIRTNGNAKYHSPLVMMYVAAYAGRMYNDVRTDGGPRVGHHRRDTGSLMAATAPSPNRSSTITHVVMG